MEHANLVSCSFVILLGSNDESMSAVQHKFSVQAQLQAVLCNLLAACWGLRFLARDASLKRIQL